MTKEKNDMTNEQNFKVGDKVRIHDGKDIYTITEIRNGLYLLSDGKGLWGDKYLTLAEPYDRKTAFLRELQALLKKFDATLVCRYHNYAQDHYPCVEFKNGETLWWSHRLNIMDFDKE